MSSFHQSRGRIFFDTLCAFGMSASCAIAWEQTYATALLGAAGVAGLFGLVRFTDMFRRTSIIAEAVAAEPAIEADVAEEIAPEPRAPVVERKSVDLAGPTPELKPEVVAALVRKPKRKSSKKPVSADEAVEQSVAHEPEPKVEPELPTAAEREPDYSAPIAPLFEPEPFMRQHQRAAFGRKFGAR